MFTCTCLPASIGVSNTAATLTCVVQRPITCLPTYTRPRWLLAGVLTLVDHGQAEGDADDAQQVAGGNQGAQDSADTQSLALPLVDQLSDRRER